MLAWELGSSQLSNESSSCSLQVSEWPNASSLANRGYTSPCVLSWIDTTAGLSRHGQEYMSAKLTLVVLPPYQVVHSSAILAVHDHASA